MSLSLSEVILAVLAGGIALYQFQAVRVRELALQAVRRACERDDVQLLDQTVSLQRVSLSRDGGGRWRVWRQYRFEYSEEGDERQGGWVIMLGRQVQALVVRQPTYH